MAIKYELDSIKNAGGEGGNHTFVRLRQLPAMTPSQLERQIEASTTLKRSDVRAVLTELGYHVINQLVSGHRFHLPEIGYLSLGVALEPSDKTPTARDIRLRTLRFQPEKRLMDTVRERMRFEKATGTSRSATYTEDELWQRVADYLSHNRYLTITDMCREFHLYHRKAKQWLTRFVEKGLIVNGGTIRRPLYFLAE